MTVQTTLARVQYNTNGTTGPWTVPFRFLDDNHLTVIYTDADEAETVLALDAGYTVTGAGDDSGGTVTTTTAYASGGTILILRSIEALQETDLVDGDSLPAETLETALDKLTMLVQQGDEVGSRALVFPRSDDTDGELRPKLEREGKMFVWDETTGTPTVSNFTTTQVASLVSTAYQTGNQQSADLVNYEQYGVGVVARSVQDRLRDVISVKDYGATGDGVTDDLDAIQTAIDENPGKTIYFPDGIYVVTDAIYVRDDGTRLVGNGFGRVLTYGPPRTEAGGSIIYQTTGGVDTVVFEPASDATRRIRAVGLSGIGIVYSEAAADVAETTGAGLRCRRIDSAHFDDFLIQDAHEGLIVQGCEMSHFGNFHIYNYEGPTYVTDKSSFKVTCDFWNGGATKSSAYTTSFDNFTINGNKVRKYAVHLAEGDGLTFSNAYIAGADEALMLVQAEYETGTFATSNYVSATGFTNVYFDCATFGSGTDYCVVIKDKNNFRRILDMHFGGGCFFANANNPLVTAAFAATSSTSSRLVFDGAFFSTCQEGIKITSGSNDNVDLQVLSCNFANCGRTSGGVIHAGNARSFVVSGTYFQIVRGAALYTVGTISSLTVTGNVNVGGEDITEAGTISRKIIAGNVSSSTAAASSWSGSSVRNLAVDDPLRLDWYEEGTFTPTITLGGAAVGVTYTTQTGSYTRIGNRLSFTIVVVLSSKGSSSGVLLVNGLPITVGDPSLPCSVYVNSVTSGVGDTAILASPASASTGVRIYKMASGTATQLTDADLTNTSDLRLSGVYRV